MTATTATRSAWDLDSPRTDWWRRGICLRLDDPDTMTPNPGDKSGTDAAKAVCTYCPVKQQCLTDAIRRGDFGDSIIAGHTGPERRHLAGDAAAVRCADCSATFHPKQTGQALCSPCSYIRHRRPDANRVECPGCGRSVGLNRSRIAPHRTPGDKTRWCHGRYLAAAPVPA